MDSDSEWDLAFQEEQILSQQESEEMESACEARSESGSESSSEGSCKGRLPCWWARVLYNAATALGLPWPDSGRPLQIVSGCTGVSAEASVLKARVCVLLVVCPASHSLVTSQSIVTIVPLLVIHQSAR
eukprot:Skav212717  [mRNA]  locus=scaffold113:587152:587538:+ [translate_table: standard]